MKDELSKSEINKDSVQHAVEAAADAVSEVATIVTGAVRDIAGALGGFATEVFEIRDAAKRAADDQTDAELAADVPAAEDTPEIDANG